MERIACRALTCGLLFSALACGPPTSPPLNEDEADLDLDLDVAIAGLAPAGSAAAIVSNDVPLSMAPGETVLARVTMRNTGAGSPQNDWDSSVQFRARSGAITFQPVPVSGVVPATPNTTHDFLLRITAPQESGTYTLIGRMYSSAPGLEGYFGPNLVIPGISTSAPSRQLDCALGSTTLPASVAPGASVPITVTLRNTGTVAWDPSFCLSPYEDIRPWITPNTWSTACTPLGVAVAPGATRALSVTLTAPTTPGRYAFIRQMYAPPALGPPSGIGLFDERAACVNRSVQVGSTTVIDLGQQASGRTLLGSIRSGQLSNVAIGDLDGDGTNEVAVAEVATVWPSGGLPARARAGRVAVYSSSAFLNGGATRLPAGAVLQVWGAERTDKLGALDGGLLIADVTGDGIADLILGASRADGPPLGNPRTDCGEIYIVRGGAALMTAGIVDLGGTSPSPHLVATIFGRTANDFTSVRATGDFNGDNIADIAIGAAGDDRNGPDAGAVTIVRGGATLTGALDLATPGTWLHTTVLGAAAGDQLGTNAAIGNFGGRRIGDLLVGSQLHSPGGRTRAGGAWGVLGRAIGYGTISLAVASSSFVRWYGQGTSDRLGAAVAVGHVMGGARPDALIGLVQQRNGAGQQVGAIDIWRGAVSAGTRDLSTGVLPTVRILGADPYDNTGYGLRVGDVNGDSRADIAVVSAFADGPGDARNRSGELLLIFGQQNLPAMIDLTTYVPPTRIHGPLPLGSLGQHIQNVAFGQLDSGRVDWCVGTFLGGGNAEGQVDCFSSPF